MNPQISIVVPLYNESEIFSELIERLKKLIEESELSIEVIMVDDGSQDNTPELMKELSLNNRNFNSVFLSRNFGHQIALSAGLKYASASEAVMIIDGDLQDPPELLNEFYKLFKQGYDVVYAIRKNRKENALKKLAYKYYYKFQKRVANIDIPLDSGDFSLISRKVVDIIINMPEESRYIRGLRTWAGFKQTGFEYERAGRLKGKTKYNFKQLFKLAFNGIFNFSELPIKFITFLGIITTSLSLFYLGTVLFKKIIWNSVPEGFTAIIVSITLFGGIQLICFGILGEYIVRIFFQVKNRPHFIVKDFIKNNTPDISGQTDNTK